MSEICQLGDSHDAPDALTARSAITHCPLLPLELLGNIYELLLTPNARLTQNAQLKFTAVSRLWRRAAYRRDLFVTGPRLDALLECLELELPSWRYDAVSLRLVCGSLKPQALGRLLNFLPGLRHAFFDFHKLKPEHLSYIAAAPCGAHLVSLRLAVDQRPSQVTFDFEAAFPSLDSLSLDEEAPSYFTRNPFPPPQLSGLSLPVWRRSPSELKPILVTASALDDPLKKLTLPFGVWWSLTDSSNLDEYLTDALDGLERLSLTSTLRIPSYPDTEEELVQEDTTYVCRRFWPKALRSLNVSTMRLRHESSVLKVVLESITGSRRAAAKSPLHQIRPDKFMDLVFSSRKRELFEAKFANSTEILACLLASQNDQHDNANLDALDRIIFVPTPKYDCWDTVSEAESHIAPLIRLAQDKGQDHLRWFFEDKLGDQHQIRAL